MVSRAAPAPAARKRQKGGMLRRKLLRDIKCSAMQFIAIILLCGMSTWVFAGLDGTWRMMDLSVETYFEENRLADFWVNAQAFTSLDLARLEHMEGVEEVQPRTTMTFDVRGLGEDVSLQVSATQGDYAINLPLVEEGSMLLPTDRRGCMLDSRFAAWHGLTVGDSIMIDMLGEDRSFVIRALVLTPEQIVTAKDVTPDPAHYGFALISSQSVPMLPQTEALISLAEGADVQKAEKLISEMMPDALIVTQQSKPSVERIRSDIVLFRNMSYLFPLMCFCVAAMIVLNTLSRMIENQRVQMGTLKALGYSDRKIRRHYLSYALWPSLIGAVLGVVTGQYSIPYIMWDMEAANFSFPWRMQPPISPLAWGSALLVVILSLMICYRTYNQSARETTASLLRPRPPAAGSRILLERISGLWRRFSFNTKMIIRNIFRNKWRTAMSLIGILCCNGLIICTQGLQESISVTTAEYYGGTLHYELRADLDAATGGTLESYQARLDAEKVEGVMEKSISLRSGAAIRTTLLTVITEDQTLILLGEGQTLIPPPDNGLIISRKLAGVMQLDVGDKAEIWFPGDDKPVYARIAALADTNFGQGVYASRSLWESFRKGDFHPTGILLENPTPLCVHQLEEMDEVTGLKRPAEQYDQTMTLMESTTAAFSIMSAAALALAFIICYNMGLMNFTERTRDYATLKVLGYHQKEIKRLMTRENDLVALCGVLLGIPPGIWLTDIILNSLETDSSAFSACVSARSILIASVVTFAFAWMIQWFLTRKVRGINMVEALKSVE